MIPTRFGKMLLLFFLAALLAPPAAYGEGISLSDLVGKIQKKYDETKDLKARFVQEAFLPSVNRTIREEGTVYFLKPKRMLWDYRVPSEKRLVVGPKDAWLYLPEDGVAYLQSTESLLKAKMSIRFLTGVGNLEDDFDISFAPEGPPEGLIDGQGNYRLVLKPKMPELGITTLTMAVNGKTHLISSFRFSDIYGNRTELTFEDMALNGGLEETLFTFTPPAGVDIYKVP